MAKQERGIYPGTADLLILRALVDEPMHGFKISRVLRRRSDGVVELRDAALYQALHRLEAEGFVESEWGMSERNRRAKFYRLTQRGRRRLRSEERSWRRYAEAVLSILDRTPGEERS